MGHHTYLSPADIYSLEAQDILPHEQVPGVVVNYLGLYLCGYDNVHALLYLSGLRRDQSRRDVSLFKSTARTRKITAKGSKYHWDFLHKLFF